MKPAQPRRGSPAKAASAGKKPANAAAPGRRAASGGQKSLAGQFLFTGAFVALLAAALPTALMLALALLPTLVAALTDRSPTRNATISIGALNVAGTWPFLLKLWTDGHTVVNAMQIIVNPAAWLVIYGAAAVGWLLYISFPALVAACMSVFAGHRMAQLRAQQKKLIEDWGPEVATNPAPHHRP